MHTGKVSIENARLNYNCMIVVIFWNQNIFESQGLFWNHVAFLIQSPRNGHSSSSKYRWNFRSIIWELFHRLMHQNHEPSHCPPYIWKRQCSTEIKLIIFLSSLGSTFLLYILYIMNNYLEKKNRIGPCEIWSIFWILVNAANATLYTDNQWRHFQNKRE